MNRPNNVLDSLTPSRPSFGSSGFCKRSRTRLRVPPLLGCCFSPPLKNSTAVITVGPAQPTPEDGFCVCVCCDKGCGAWKRQTPFSVMLVGLPSNYFPVPQTRRRWRWRGRTHLLVGPAPAENPQMERLWRACRFTVSGQRLQDELM